MFRRLHNATDLKKINKKILGYSKTFTFYRIFIRNVQCIPEQKKKNNKWKSVRD